MKYILGKKEKMSQVFDETGAAHPVTVVQTSPIKVTQIKTAEKDGYQAVQFGYGQKAQKNISKPQKGHQKDLGSFAQFRENLGQSDLKVGDVIDVTAFSEGDKIKVRAISKGKGFQGAVKRYGFAGGRRTHGQKHSEREVGSIGATGPARVFKGTRMPGRMGGDLVSVRNLKIVKIDKDSGKIYIKGAVPGHAGSLVEVIGK